MTPTSPTPNPTIFHFGGKGHRLKDEGEAKKEEAKAKKKKAAADESRKRQKGEWSQLIKQAKSVGIKTPP